MKRMSSSPIAFFIFLLYLPLSASAQEVQETKKPIKFGLQVAQQQTTVEELKEVWQEAEALVVHDQDAYSAALYLLKKYRAEKKDIGFVLDPGIQSAKTHLEFLREEKGKHIRPIDELDKLVTGKASVWREQERKAAAEEQERLNEARRRQAAREAEEQRRATEAQAKIDLKKREKEIEEARKSGEVKKREADRLAKIAREDAVAVQEQAQKDAEAAAQVKEVKVAPSIPKISGIKGRTNWKFNVVNASKVPRRYCMPDEVAIGSRVRALKDKEKAEAEIPGIEVWSKDSV